MDWKLEADQLKIIAPKHILFLCVANSARSQMAEGVAKHLAPSTIKISSAGSRPSFVHPMAIKVLNEVGIEVKDQHSKLVDTIDPTGIEAVITLCAEEVCPLFLGKAKKIHWGLPDPAGFPNEEERLIGFRKVRDELIKRLTYLFKE